MGFFLRLTGADARRRARREQSQIKDEQQAIGNQINDTLSSLNESAIDAKERSSLTAEDLYGSEMQRQKDSIRENANDTKQALARLALANPSDASVNAVNLDKLDSGVNEAIGDMEAQYSMAAMTEATNANAQANNLLAGILNAQQNQYGIKSNELNTAKLRETQRRQANKQLFADFIGAGANVLGGAL